MQALGASLARALAAPARRRARVVVLDGPLGAGKTTLVRGLLAAYGHRGPVPSPTYTLAEPYRPPGGPRVVHVDLYRLGDPGELEFLGWRDWLAEPGVIVIEWPGRVPALASIAELRVAIDAGADETSRAVTVTDPGGLLDGEAARA